MNVQDFLNKKYTKPIIAGALLLGLGFGIGKFSQPAKVVTKVETKEVIKLVENKQERKNVVVISDKVTKPDGTVIEHTKTEDKTETDTKLAIDSSKESKIESTQIRDSGLSVHALVLSDIKDFNNREYGVLIKKRIIGNVSGAIQATNKGTIGLSVGLDF